MIKCVVWDLDNTLLDGVYLESPGQPPAANTEMARILAELSGRGILQAIASRNPPEAGRHAEAVAGHAFAAIQCGWGAKSAAVSEIIAELGLRADSVAFVDDDALERAEVSFALPDVLVLEPQDMAEAASWPQFSPPVVTDESRRRGELYQQRRNRLEEARAFSGSRDEFLRQSGTQVRITGASTADLPRLHELSVRTHQFNSTGKSVTEGEFGAVLGSPEHRVLTVWLHDRYGDDGMVGGCVIADAPDGGWDVPLLMMSCRAMGRGVIDALLAWVCLAAKAAGAAQVSLPCVINSRNVPLRIALTGAGFRAGQPEADAGAATEAGSGRTAKYVRRLDQPLPAIPQWVSTEVTSDR